MFPKKTNLNKKFCFFFGFLGEFLLNFSQRILDFLVKVFVLVFSQDQLKALYNQTTGLLEHYIGEWGCYASI